MALARASPVRLAQSRWALVPLNVCPVDVDQALSMASVSAVLPASTHQTTVAHVWCVLQVMCPPWARAPVWPVLPAQRMSTMSACNAALSTSPRASVNANPAPTVQWPIKRAPPNVNPASAEPNPPRWMTVLICIVRLVLWVNSLQMVERVSTVLKATCLRRDHVRVLLALRATTRLVATFVLCVRRGPSPRAMATACCVPMARWR